MDATIKLYDSYPYETHFQAEVLSVSPGRASGTQEVILDRTLFFPEEGGQTPDRGTLNGFPVTDVRIGRDGVITHTVRTDAAFPGRGAAVCGILDWDHRFSNMQNHSGEHILSGLLHTLYGYENVGFRLSDNTVTLDTSGQLTPAQLTDLENRANDVVYRNVGIRCGYPPADVLAGMEYRSKKAIDGPVRIVTIEGVDVCACCAPHVRRTGEIGLIRIIGVLHTKNSMRLTIVCGRRALQDAQRKQEQIAQISHLTNVPQERAAEGVHRLLEEIAQLKEGTRMLEEQYIRARLSQIPIPPEEDAPRDLWIFEHDLSPLSQRSFVNRLCERRSRFCGVFVGDDQRGYSYIIGSRGNDARIPNAILKERCGARGGGKPDMVNGSLKAGRQAILEALSPLSG